MSIVNYMEVLLPAKLSKIPDYTRGRSDRLKIVIHDHGGWIIDYTVNPAAVLRTEEWGDAQVEFTESQFWDFISDPYSGLKMYELKQVIVKGMTFNLMDLPRLFSMIRDL